MHIPDGYLSPLVSAGLGVATVPAWAIATQRVKRVLNNRTIPLLAIFAALSFTIMLFNIPVVGGTTAHGVGGTLIAVVLGPPAAIIAVSTALVIQALFFGDGGIIAIFANCLNMAVLLPVTGWLVYRLLAGRSPQLSTRRAVAAAIGAYVGISVSALAVGIELGIEPLLFSENGRPLYSAYTLEQAVPALLVAHLFGASIVEAALTGLGFAYIQRRHPEFLRASRTGSSDPSADALDANPPRRPVWQPVLAATAISLVALIAVGLLAGGGDPHRLFGADWAAVDWTSVAIMAATVTLVGAVAIPLAYVLLPAGLRRLGTAFTALAVIAPVGLIAPGIAYGEGTPAQVQAAFGYVPKGLQDLSGLFSAPLAGYALPGLSAGRSALWQAGLAYELSGLFGMLLIGAAVLAIGRLLRGRDADEPAHEAEA